MRTATTLLLIVALLALPACQMNERMSGAAFGGTGGAVLGGLIAESLTGVLVGGLAGGVVGYLIGDYLADQRERCSPCAPNPCDPCAPQPQYYQPCPQPCPQPQAYSQPCAPASYVTRTQPSRDAATVWIQRGRQARTLPEALAAYEQAVTVDPRSADAWNALGLARQAGGDAVGARAAFRQALQVDPNHWAARQNLRWTGP